MENQDEKKEFNQEEAPVQPVQETAPVAPVVEAQPEPEPEAPIVPAQLPTEACGNCLGEGLLGDPQGQNSVCPACNGTGVVK